MAFAFHFIDAVKWATVVSLALTILLGALEQLQYYWNKLKCSNEICQFFEKIGEGGLAIVLPCEY